MSEVLTSRNAILNAAKKRIKPLTVPDLGTVYIRRLSGLDVARLGDSYKGAEDRSIEANERAIQCRIVQLSLVDENGERLFGESELDQVGELDKDVLDLITTSVTEFSGLNVTVRDAEKNSETPQISSPPSSSAVN